MKSMNRMVRSWLAACLAVIMCLSLLPIQARAAGLDQNGATDNGGEMINVHIVDDDSNVRTDSGNNRTEVTFPATQALLYSIRGTAGNPHFTVQYYAMIPVVQKNNDNYKENVGNTIHTNELPVIDTSGGKLPQNGKGENVSPNGNPITNLYVNQVTGDVVTERELVEVYRSREYDYIYAPNIRYIDVLSESDKYDVSEIWVSDGNCGDGPDCINAEHWLHYPISGNIHFTNRVSVYEKDRDNYILISNGSVVRFVYQPSTSVHKRNVSFYDYDITDGRVYYFPNNSVHPFDKSPYTTSDKITFNDDGSFSDDTLALISKNNGDGHLYIPTTKKGINSPSNYSGSGAMLGFGNSNTNSGLAGSLWNQNTINMGNANSYKRCTFGIATGFVGGRIQYADGIDVPSLFDDEVSGNTPIGKSMYVDRYGLSFDRIGDTYTLMSVYNKEEGSDVVNGLNSFNHPSRMQVSSTDPKTMDFVEFPQIWTNNFWPMDDAPSFGSMGHDVKFGSGALSTYSSHHIRYGANEWTTVPISDDGKLHNSYFGMNYSVNFTLSEDYIGPLEYYFFGDDDMWVFLDGKLVCDIGGVHSSVGEYVNLWDYLEKGSEKSAGEHVLTFYYTERGASGSTCYMQFTLPSVDFVAPNQGTGNLEIQKDVSDTTPNPEDIFSFEIKFMSDDEDITERVMLDDYSYTYWAWEQDDAGNFLWKEDGTPKLTESIGLLIKGDGNEWDAGNEWADMTEDELNDVHVIHSGTGFTLRAGEKLIIKHLPVDTRFVITEVDDNTGMWTVENGSQSTTGVNLGTTDGKGQNLSGTVGTGVIFENENTVTAHFVNVYHALYEMPKTGGPGTTVIYAAGVSILVIAGILCIKRRRRA